MNVFCVQDSLRIFLTTGLPIPKLYRGFQVRCPIIIAHALKNLLTEGPFTGDKGVTTTQ